MSRLPSAPRVSVFVNKQNIAESVKENSSHCMTAEAVKESYPGAKFVSVDISTIRFTDTQRGLRFVYLTPRIVQVNILRFDQGLAFNPFRFQLRNGSVSRAQSRKGQLQLNVKKPKRQMTEKTREALKKAQLVGVRKTTQNTSIRVVGGKTPPKLPHMRRQFGMRAFGDIASAALDDAVK